METLVPACMEEYARVGAEMTLDEIRERAEARRDVLALYCELQEKHGKEEEALGPRRAEA